MLETARNPIVVVVVCEMADVQTRNMPVNVNQFELSMLIV